MTASSPDGVTFMVRGPFQATSGSGATSAYMHRHRRFDPISPSLLLALWLFYFLEGLGARVQGEEQEA